MPCDEWHALHNESTKIFAEWANLRDVLKMTRKTDPRYTQVEAECKELHRKLSAIQKRIEQHANKHSCT